jgi:hypothetical protein
MRSNFRVGKTIAGFAYTVSRHESDNSRMLFDTFAKTKDKATEKLKTSKKYFYTKDIDLKYRLFSVHMTVMHELEFNLDEDDSDGFPVLDDDDKPEVKTIRGRVVVEDAFQ